jgi:hypothetical protein
VVACCHLPGFIRPANPIQTFLVSENDEDITHPGWFFSRVELAENMPDGKYFLALALEARAARDWKIEEAGVTRRP